MGHIAKPILVLLLLLTGQGCSTFAAPTATVTGVNVTEVTDEAMTLAFDIVLENPNEEPLELYELHYTLQIDGRPVYDGRRSAQATLAASSTRKLTVPAVARFEASPSIARAGREGGSYEFALNGQLGYLTPDRFSRVLRDLHLRRPKVRFEADGVVESPSDP